MRACYDSQREAHGPHLAMAGILFLNAMLLVYTAVIVPVQVPFLKRSYFRVTREQDVISVTSNGDKCIDGLPVVISVKRLQKYGNDILMLGSRSTCCCMR